MTELAQMLRLEHLFQSEPESVAATIRRRRPERCHADLTEPRLRHRTIGETSPC
ncbi:hypothetical protein [Streptomyces sp. NPDC021139]|uniref:hypothetical protein n=1 Tax=unclassified Streptomyces TaxID=2593676 RepID=UPI0033ED597E